MRTSLRSLCHVAVAGLLGISSTTAFASDRLAYVVANSTAAQSPVPARDGLAISRQLLGLGFDVIRRENISPAALPLGKTAAETVVLYYAGRTEAREGQTVLMGNRDSGWPLVETARNFMRAGASEVVIFVDHCHAMDSTTAPFPSDKSAELSNTLIVMSAAPGLTCQSDKITFAERIQAALGKAQLDLVDAIATSEGPGWVRSTLQSPLRLHATQPQNQVLSQRSDGSRGVADIVLLDQVEAETALRVETVREVDVSALSAAQTRNSPLADTTTTDTQAAGAVQIFDISPSQLTPAIVEGEKPRPSILVGTATLEAASFAPTVIDTTPSGTALTLDDNESRVEFRTQNAALYRDLVTSGALDPLPDQLATSLQIELQRMGCYSSDIDGIWGPGSEAAVRRYLAQIDQNGGTTEPSFALFRQILLEEDVTCSEVQPTAPQTVTTARPAAATRTPAQAQPPRPSQPTATPPRRQQPAATPSRRQQPAAPSRPSNNNQLQIRPNLFGTGIRG